MATGDRKYRRRSSSRTSDDQGNAYCDGCWTLWDLGYFDDSSDSEPPQPSLHQPPTGVAENRARNLRDMSTGSVHCAPHRGCSNEINGDSVGCESGGRTRSHELPPDLHSAHLEALQGYERTGAGSLRREMAPSRTISPQESNPGSPRPTAARPTAIRPTAAWLTKYTGTGPCPVASALLGAVRSLPHGSPARSALEGVSLVAALDAALDRREEAQRRAAELAALRAAARECAAQRVGAHSRKAQSRMAPLTAERHNIACLKQAFTRALPARRDAEDRKVKSPPANDAELGGGP
ncbi:MAG: hypothetical protein SGPRY_002715 [Prymnesium sp.]